MITFRLLGQHEQRVAQTSSVSFGSSSANCKMRNMKLMYTKYEYKKYPTKQRTAIIIYNDKNIIS